MNISLKTINRKSSCRLSITFIMQLLSMVICTMSISSNSVWAEPKGDPLNDIKSVYIYNFLSFIEWPAPQDNHYQLCLSASDAMYNSLKTVVEGETVGDMPISLRKVEDGLEGCHLIYWQTGVPMAEDTLIALEKSKALLVSDQQGFTSNGMGMVGFETRGRKVRVAMNLTIMENAGFKVSSKLLRVVRIER